MQEQEIEAIVSSTFLGMNIICALGKYTVFFILFVLLGIMNTMNTTLFDTAYKMLNIAQKEAVDTIEGPVMVVAGPGTGKTQVLALRIANILRKTDTGAGGILCLTFTNSGVHAMRERLESYIGHTAHDVRVSTFHSFAIDLIEKNYELLDFIHIPTLLTDEDAVSLVDEILTMGEWEHLRPRGNPSQYFGELKQLISILKRERLTPEEFLQEVNVDIERLHSDPESISTRGESKGSLKKEIEKKIASLERTREVVEFYRLYEKKKYENGFMDYDDVLSYAVTLAENFDDVRAEIKETYLYVLVDEHQDSSGIQNSFLKAVWQDADLPNIFVVGDDRQLIYGFSGASLSYFEEFRTTFGKAKLLTLSENYRSTAPILSLADDLLTSTITNSKLHSTLAGDSQIIVAQYAYPRDEILGAGLYFKKQIEGGVLPSECALLVPKNYHVRTALEVFRSMGLPVSSGKSLSLFTTAEAQSFYRVLSLISDPYNSTLLVESLLDQTSNIIPLEAHKFLKNTKPDKLTIDELLTHGTDQSLFSGENSIAQWAKKLTEWTTIKNKETLSRLVSVVGNELLIDAAENHDELLRTVEVVRSFIHLALAFEARHSNAHLSEFIEYLSRLQSYGTHIELATFGGSEGIQVMTLHKSKGLEYQSVWIAHMNEEVLMSEKKTSFTLPEKVKLHINERDEAAARRELYVAITRAKNFCTISYASESYSGAPLECAHIITELESKHLNHVNREETEKELLNFNPKIFTSNAAEVKGNMVDDLTQFVKGNYAGTKVSVTLLNNFFECPWKWYFRNFLKLPEVKSVSLALGSAVHSTIEYILKSSTLPQTKDIKEKIIAELQKEGVQNEKDIKQLSKDAESAVSNWIKNYYKLLSKDYISERSVQFRDTEFGELLMYGKLDLTERFPDGSIVITDFKTGTTKTKGVIEKRDDEGKLSSYMRQLAMYSYLIEGTEKGKTVSASRLLFLEADLGDKNALYSTRISEEEIDLLKKDIRTYNSDLSSGSWVNNTCNFKPWGSNTDECQYCKLSKKIFEL